ncbi:MAG: hypothetical protein P8Z79_25060 [Sedimentisphaerales bacterium]
MVEEQSEIGRDARLALLLRYKWQEEIEKAIGRVKKSRTHSEADKWFRKQWYRSMMRDRKRKLGQNIRSAASPSRLTSTPDAHEQRILHKNTWCPDRKPHCADDLP